MRLKLQQAISIVVLLLLLCEADVGAQTQPKLESASLELVELVRKKRDSIELEASTSLHNEWVGTYWSVDGPTVSTSFGWSPNSGFAVMWYNCSRPLDLVNYGSAVFENGSLKLRVELPENSPGAYRMGSELIPIKWGDQHFLVPEDQLLNFIYAVNSTSTPEIETYLHKREDLEKSRRGLPALPESYRKYVGMKPIVGAITEFLPRQDRYAERVMLNVGRAEGVIPRMYFYDFRMRGIYMRLYVREVQEHTSEASIFMATHEGPGNREVRPKVGWKVTSRAPKNESSFWP
jgi:hypothetical protein